MNKLYFFLILFLPCCLFAQNLDVTILSQNDALADSSTTAPQNIGQIAPYPSISETYEIPAFSLYQQYWDTNNLRSKQLTIPFSNDRLLIMLVQDANNPFVMPCSFDKIKNSYGLNKKGDFHPGIDLATEPQTLVKSCFDGVVRMSKFYGDYGFLVTIRHYNGIETVYSHLDKTCVKPGQIVKSGQVIGQTGTSGKTHDCILHFETRFLNEHFNPELIIDFEEEDLLQNSFALMSHDFDIIPIDSVSNRKTAQPKANNAPQTQKSPETTKPSEQIKSATENKSSKVEENTEKNNNFNFDDSQQPVYHIVKAGENLYRISLKYNTTTDKILRLNNINNPDKITEGSRIRVK